MIKSPLPEHFLPLSLPHPRSLLQLLLSLLYLFHKRLVSTSSEEGRALSTENTVMNKADELQALMQQIF